MYVAANASGVAGVGGAASGAGASHSNGNSNNNTAKNSNPPDDDDDDFYVPTEEVKGPRVLPPYVNRGTFIPAKPKLKKPTGWLWQKLQNEGGASEEVTRQLHEELVRIREENKLAKLLHEHEVQRIGQHHIEESVQQALQSQRGHHPSTSTSSTFSSSASHVGAPMHGTMPGRPGQAIPSAAIPTPSGPVSHVPLPPAPALPHLTASAGHAGSGAIDSGAAVAAPPSPAAPARAARTCSLSPSPTRRIDDDFVGVHEPIRPSIILPYADDDPLTRKWV